MVRARAGEVVDVASGAVKVKPPVRGELSGSGVIVLPIWTEQSGNPSKRRSHAAQSAFFGAGHDRCAIVGDAAKSLK